MLPKRALASYKIGIFSDGIRTSGLEVLLKGALTVLPMQSGASQGSTQGAPQDSEISPVEETGGEHSRCCSMPINAIARVLYCFFKKN